MKQVLEEVKAWALANGFKGSGRYYEKKLPFGLLSIRMPFGEKEEEDCIVIDLMAINGNMKIKDSKILYLLILDRAFDKGVVLREVVSSLVHGVVDKMVFN